MTRHDSNWLPFQPPDPGTFSTGPSKQPIKLLLTEGEAAKALGVCRRTLWTLRNQGKIPFVRIGKCVRYSVESLKEWIEQRKQENGKPNLPR